MAARAGPHDGGADRAADGPLGPEVGEHIPEGILTRRNNSCRVAMRQITDRAGLCGDLVLHSVVETAHRRVRRRAGESEAPAVAVEAGYSPRIRAGRRSGEGEIRNIKKGYLRVRATIPYHSMLVLTPVLVRPPLPHFIFPPSNPARGVSTTGTPGYTAPPPRLYTGIF